MTPSTVTTMVRRGLRRCWVYAACLLLSACVGANALERYQLEQLAQREELLHDGTIRAMHPFPDGTTLLYLTAGQRDAQHLPARECTALARRDGGARSVQVQACGGHNPSDVRGPFWVSSAGLTTISDAPADLEVLQEPLSYASAYGLAADPAIATVTLWLADGATISGAVQDGAFLIVALGEVSPVRITATNAYGERLYEQQLQ